MAAAVAQHAAERKLFVAGELAAANGPNKLVVSGVSSSAATQFALIRYAIAFLLHGLSDSSTSYVRL